MATTINAGRVAMVPKGEWSASTAYARLDVVSYHGSSYVCKQDGTGQTPDTATNYWQLLSSGLDPTVDTIAAKHYEGSTLTAETSISAAGVISKTANNVTKTFNLPAESGTLATTDQVAAKQNALVSGTNIKTVNSNSLLGSGNVNIDGITSISTQQDGTVVITVASGDTYTINFNHVHNKSVVSSSDATVTLDAHIIYDLGTVAGDKTINLPSTVDAGAEYEFRLAYTSGTISGTAISGTAVANDATLTFTAGKTYQVIISGGILYYSETTIS